MPKKIKCITDKITIVVPVYNTEKYLNNCLSSIINQTYSNLEILIVDDGSTDNSLSVCNEFAKKDRRIRVVQKKNGGVSSARNIGIMNSTGVYIAFVDSDDIIANDMVNILVHNINEADVSLINETAVIDTDIINSTKTVNKSVIISGEEASKIMLYENGINNSIHGLIYRKEHAGRLFFDEDIAYGEDLDFKFRVLTNAKKVIRNSKVGYFYVKRDSSAMHAPFTNKRADSLKVTLNNLDCATNQTPALIKATKHKVFLEALSVLRAINDKETHKSVYNECTLQIKKFRIGVIFDKFAPLQHRIYAIIALINIPILLHIINYKNILLKRQKGLS